MCAIYFISAYQCTIDIPLKQKVTKSSHLQYCWIVCVFINGSWIKAIQLSKIKILKKLLKMCLDNIFKTVCSFAKNYVHEMKNSIKMSQGGQDSRPLGICDWYIQTDRHTPKWLQIEALSGLSELPPFSPLSRSGLKYVRCFNKCGDTKQNQTLGCT